MSGSQSSFAPTTTSNGGQAAQVLNAGGLGSQLMELLGADAIEPGSDPSYQTCKVIYEYHPLGGRIVDAPIIMAQSQARELSIKDGPSERLVEAFEKEWMALQSDIQIANARRLGRIYGIASLACVERGKDPSTPLDLSKLPGADIYFSAFDPLNTAGSLTLNQNPNDPDFMKPNDVRVQGVSYHRSRCVITMNEAPIYLSWTASAFGFVGRSVFQRALFPLKSFLGTMLTDDLISRKAGLLIAKIKQVGSVINAIMSGIGMVKRNLLVGGMTGNVLQVGSDDAIESLNLMNIDGAGKFARDNIIKNISTAVPMPARWITQDSLAEGFGEGNQDAAAEAVFVDIERRGMQPLYDYMDRIVMARAWSPEFYASVQADFPDYQGMDYATAFTMWKNGFSAVWPSFMQEPESKKTDADKTQFEAVEKLAALLLPILDPDNKAAFVQWMQGNVNERKLLFPVPLNLDIDALRSYEPPAQVMAGGENAERPDSVVPLHVAA